MASFIKKLLQQQQQESLDEAGTTTTGPPATAAAVEGKMDGTSDNDSTAEVIQKVQESIRKRDWKGTMRGPTTFLNAGAFSRPSSMDDVAERVQANLMYFMSNYVAICLIILCLVVITRPLLMVVSIILILLWAVSMNQPQIKVGSVTLEGRRKMYVLAGLSAALIFLTAGTTIFFVIGLCCSLVLAHASLHQPVGIEGMDGNDIEMA